MPQKIYTKKGDDGTTALLGEKRVPKYDLHIEAIGTVDELNSLVGIVRTLHPPSEITNILEKIQNDFFVAGCDITACGKRHTSLPHIEKSHIDFLEQAIDQFDTHLPTLKAFILPGGTPVAAHLHAARAFCRRVERILALLATKETMNPLLLPYFNRCSDLLFVLARFANAKENIPDIEWRH